jgi:hypothetical protein
MERREKMGKGGIIREHTTIKGRKTGSRSIGRNEDDEEGNTKMTRGNSS